MATYTRRIAQGLVETHMSQMFAYVNGAGGTEQEKSVVRLQAYRLVTDRVREMSLLMLARTIGYAPEGFMLYADFTDIAERGQGRAILKRLAVAALLAAIHERVHELSPQ